MMKCEISAADPVMNPPGEHPSFQRGEKWIKFEAGSQTPIKMEATQTSRHNNQDEKVRL